MLRHADSNLRLDCDAPKAARRLRVIDDLGGILIPRTACLGLLLSALFVTGCDNLLLSKEQRQMNSAIKQAITTDPSRIDAPIADGEPPLHIALTYHLPALLIGSWIAAPTPMRGTAGARQPCTRQ